MKIGADVSTDQNQVDFAAAVLKAKQGGGDVLFAYTNEEESARLLRELRKQVYAKPIIGDTTIVSQKAIELAGDAANGVMGHVPLTSDAPQDPVKAFDAKFQKARQRRGLGRAGAAAVARRRRADSAGCLGVRIGIVDAIGGLAPRHAVPLHAAKARFSELVRMALSHGPQHVTLHGRDAAVRSRCVLPCRTARQRWA
jgi:hypothetical protein